jgi:hypothetical protein
LIRVIRVAGESRANKKTAKHFVRAVIVSSQYRHASITADMSAAIRVEPGA